MDVSLDRLVAVADARLLTNNNIMDLIENEYDFILGARIKNESSKLKQKIVGRKYENGQGHIFNKDDSVRLIVNYSEKRAKKDIRNRRRGLENPEKKLSKGKLAKSNINNRGYNKYLTLTGKTDISIDYDKFNADAKWDGLKGYVTNTDLSPNDLMANYSELWKIEKAFRISKTDLRVRPIYHRLERRIETHICISFAAYKVYKELERQLKLKDPEISVERAIELIRTIYGVTIEHPSLPDQKQMTFIKNSEQAKILRLFEIPLGDPKRLKQEYLSRNYFYTMLAAVLFALF